MIAGATTHILKDARPAWLAFASSTHGVGVLRDKLRYWDYTDVLSTHESLENVNESINALGLVPQGFVAGS